MFVAHHIVTMDKCFRTKLSPTAALDDPLTPLVTQVRALGNEHLTQYLASKKDEVFVIMQEAQGESVS